MAAPVVAPPYVITKAGLVLADGVWVTLVGLIGLGVGGGNLTRVAAMYAGLCLFTLLLQLALYDTASVGLVAMAIPVGSLQVVLTTALMLMPAYAARHLNVLEDLTELGPSASREWPCFQHYKSWRSWQWPGRSCSFCRKLCVTCNKLLSQCAVCSWIVSV